MQLCLNEIKWSVRKYIRDSDVKLNIVSIKKLHKYISTEIKFDDDLSIITGVNGSGKTQILKLIEATLRLNINYLYEIDFTEFNLEFENDQKIYNVSINKNQNSFTFSVNDESIKIANIKNRNSIFARRKSIQEEFVTTYQELIFKSSNSSFVVFSEIKPPLFLGLNRIVDIDDEEYSDSFERSKKDSWLRSGSSGIKSINSDHMSNSIAQCKKLILRESEAIKKYEDAQTSVLRNKIISSSFDYLDGNFISHEDLASKLESVYKRKDSIIDELEKLNINDVNTNTQIRIFFDKLYNLMGAFEDNQQIEITFELLLNLSQIERVSNILSIIDDNKKTMDVKKEKLTLFVNTVNEFFHYTGKKIQVSNLGRVYVVVNSKHRVELENLSSGEMQLISIISNMIFCKNNNRGLVVIIDEPEISLHIKWQEIFIEVLEGIKKDAQLILATHSPDIIGDKEVYCRPIRNSLQNKENKNG